MKLELPYFPPYPDYTIKCYFNTDEMLYQHFSYEGNKIPFIAKSFDFIFQEDIEVDHDKFMDDFTKNFIERLNWPDWIDSIEKVNWGTGDFRLNENWRELLIEFIEKNYSYCNERIKEFYRYEDLWHEHSIDEFLNALKTRPEIVTENYREIIKKGIRDCNKIWRELDLHLKGEECLIDECYIIAREDMYFDNYLTYKRGKASKEKRIKAIQENMKAIQEDLDYFERLINNE